MRITTAKERQIGWLEEQIRLEKKPAKREFFERILDRVKAGQEYTDAFVFVQNSQPELTAQAFGGRVPQSAKIRVDFKDAFVTAVNEAICSRGLTWDLAWNSLKRERPGLFATCFNVVDPTVHSGLPSTPADRFVTEVFQLLEQRDLAWSEAWTATRKQSEDRYKSAYQENRFRGVDSFTGVPANQPADRFRALVQERARVRQEPYGTAAKMVLQENEGLQTAILAAALKPLAS